MEQDHNPNVLPLTQAEGRNESLPYRIELWDSATDAAERVLALAVSVELAQAMFKAAQVEHPERRILLRRGSDVIADSARL